MLRELAALALYLFALAGMLAMVVTLYSYLVTGLWLWE